MQGLGLGLDGVEQVPGGVVQIEGALRLAVHVEAGARAGLPLVQVQHQALDGLLRGQRVDGPVLGLQRAVRRRHVKHHCKHGGSRVFRECCTS